MNHMARLVSLCKDVATTEKASPLEHMKALYDLRQHLVNLEVPSLHVSVELALHDTEQRLSSEADREEMRVLGYQFPEDWDQPKQFLCGG